MLAWIEDDPYGFCYDLDREAAKVLDKQGLDAFVRRVRARFEAALARDGNERWGDALKTLLAAQRSVDEYIGICEQTGIGAKECKVIAELYRNRKCPEKALSWVERGLDMMRADGRSYDSHELHGMKRALLAALGHDGAALESAWSAFKDCPSMFTYKELMRYVPAKEKNAWHEKAMEASEKGGLSDQIELWLKKKEIDRLISRLRRVEDEELEGISHFTT